MATRFLARWDEEGRLCPASPRRFKACKEVWISLHEQPVMGLRSDASNKYLWGVVYKAISEETGNLPLDIHYGLKRKAIEEGVLEPEFILLGEKMVEADPTTRTDQDTFNRYVDWIRALAEHGDLTGWSFHIPEANE